MKKIRKQNTKFRNNAVNKFISLTLLVSIPISISGCTENEDFHENDLTNQTTYSDLNDYGLKNYEECYEYDDAELNDLIDEIKSIKYISNYSDFDNYNIYEKPSLELSEISYYNSSKSEDYPLNYDWYNNGIIDEDLLYKKIYENNENAGIKNKKEVREIIRLIPDVINKNVNLIRNKDNQFEFNIAFYNLNNLVIDITGEDDFATYYDADNNKISINYDFVINNDELKNILSHECFHLLFNKCIDCLPFYHNGCAIDAVCTDESPLIHTFLIELVTEDFSFEAFDETPNALYDDERDKLNLICKATDKDVDYFKNAVVTSDSNYIMTAFEMEFRSVNYVYSIFNSLDKVCGYGYFDENWDYDLFKSACFNYAKIGLLKNAYVKIIKQYKMNLISIEDVNYKIDEIKSLFNNSSCDYEIDDSYLECVKKLDEILRKAM